jgi:hypothetical protein
MNTRMVRTTEGPDGEVYASLDDLIMLVEEAAEDTRALDTTLPASAPLVGYRLVANSLRDLREKG